MERTLTAQALVATAGVILGPGSVARFDPEDSPLQGGCVADFRGDGSTNTIDVLGFLNAWSTGC